MLSTTNSSRLAPMNNGLISLIIGILLIILLVFVIMSIA